MPVVMRMMMATTKLKHDASHVMGHTAKVTRHTSHVTCHTSHVIRHTSHVTRHTSHVTRHLSQAAAATVTSDVMMTGGITGETSVNLNPKPVLTALAGVMSVTTETAGGPRPPHITTVAIGGGGWGGVGCEV